LIRKSIMVVHRGLLCVLIALALTAFLLAAIGHELRRPPIPHSWTPLDSNFHRLTVKGTNWGIHFFFWRSPPCPYCEGTIDWPRNGCTNERRSVPRIDTFIRRFRWHGSSWRTLPGYPVQHYVHIAYWFLGAAFGIYPLFYFGLRLLRRGKRKPGHCVKCGYNLTGLPRPRCPECGTAQPEPDVDSRP